MCSTFAGWRDFRIDAIRRICQASLRHSGKSEQNYEKDEQPVANLLRNTSNGDVGPFNRQLQNAVPRRNQRFDY